MNLSDFWNRAVVFWEKYNPPGPAERKKAFLKKPENFLFILYALFTFLMVFFHEPWRDEAQGFLIVRDLSLPDLFKQLHNEVHFPLWYLFIFPFVKLSIPIFGVNLIHWLLACILAWLILEKFPFRLLTRTALLFTFPLFFEYSVVARNYTVGLLLLAIFLLLWKELWKRPNLMAVLLALILLSDPFFAGIVSGLCLCIFLQACKKGVLKQKEFIIPVIIVGSAIVSALILVFSFSSPFVITNAVSPLGTTLFQRLWGVFKVMGKLFGLYPVMIAVLTFLTLYCLRKSKEGLIIFTVSSVITYAAFVLGNFNGMRHGAFCPVGAAAAFFVASGKYPFMVKGRILQNILSGIFILLVVWSTFFLTARSFSALKNEIIYDFSHGKNTADFINKTASSCTVFYTDPTYYTPVIASLNHKKTFSLNMGKYTTFSPWLPLPASDLNKIPENVLKNLPLNEDFALYVSMIYHLPAKKAENLFLLYTSLKEHAGAWAHPEESYWVFLIVKPEKAHLYKEKFPLYDPLDFR